MNFNRSSNAQRNIQFSQGPSGQANPQRLSVAPNNWINGFNNIQANNTLGQTGQSFANPNTQGPSKPFVFTGQARTTSSGPSCGSQTNPVQQPNTGNLTKTPLFTQNANASLNKGANPLFGHTSNSKSNQGANPLFGQANNPQMNQRVNPAFGQATNPAINQAAKPLFGQATNLANNQAAKPLFGQAPNPAINQTAKPLFGQAANPAINQTAKPLFGQATNPAINQTTNPMFGQATNPAINQTTNPMFGQATNPAINQTTNPMFGQATNPAISQTTNPIFGQTINPGICQTTSSNLPITSGNTPNPFVPNQIATSNLNQTSTQCHYQNNGMSSMLQTGTSLQNAGTNQQFGVNMPQSMNQSAGMYAQNMNQMAGMHNPGQGMTPTSNLHANSFSEQSSSSAMIANPYLNMQNTIIAANSIPNSTTNPCSQNFTGFYCQGSTAPSTPVGQFAITNEPFSQQIPTIDANRMVPAFPLRSEDQDFVNAFRDPHGLSWLYSNSISRAHNTNFYKRYIFPSYKAKKNHVVAAKINKYEGTTDFKFSGFISKSSPSKPRMSRNRVLKMDNLKSSHISVDSENPPTKELVSEEMLPVLTKKGYYTIPSIEQMRAMTESEIAAVPDFTIGNEHGKVVFEGKTNVSRLDLDKIISIREKELLLYPDESGISKPAEGKELNKRARVHLYNCRLHNGKIIQESQIRRLCLKIQVQFVSWDADTKEWVFDINKF